MLQGIFNEIDKKNQVNVSSCFKGLSMNKNDVEPFRDRELERPKKS